MKKHIFLAVGIAALYMAAKEYGINNLDDLKRVLKPYTGMLDMNELTELLGGEEESSSSNSGRASRVTHES